LIVEIVVVVVVAVGGGGGGGGGCRFVGLFMRSFYVLFVLLLCCWGFPVSFAMCSFVCVSFGSVHCDTNLLLGTFVK